MQDMFFHERRKASIHFGLGFQFPVKLVARPVHAWWQMHGGSLWIRKLGASVVSPEETTHVPSRQRSEARHHRLFLGVNSHQTSDTEMRDCGVSSLGSALWCQAYAQHQIRIGGVLAADWERSASEVATIRTHSNDRKRTAAIWNEARRSCVFEGKKPRCQDGQEDTQAACSQDAHACGFLEEADELDHALETWSDATTQYWVKLGRMSQIPLSGKFPTFRMKPVLGETFMPLGCVILVGGGNAVLRAWKAFGQWINTMRKASPKSQNTRCMPPGKLSFSFKVATLSKKGEREDAFGHRLCRWAEEEGYRKCTGEVKTGVFGGHPGFMKLTRRMKE